MDLSIKEKYPDSLRINHPDFVDVGKTTYAKGVICDFEIVSKGPFESYDTFDTNTQGQASNQPYPQRSSDGSFTIDYDPDPCKELLYKEENRFKVRSKVKVKGNWGTSDYIPLFYHPKPGYWDTEFDGEELATAFNEEGKYFEKSWMCFRCGDEVAVMLREGVPVAVLGFADGKPRVGEAVAKAVGEWGPYWFKPCDGACNFPAMGQFSWRVSELPESEFGPDGLPVGLSEIAAYIGGSWVAHPLEEEVDGWEIVPVIYTPATSYYFIQGDGPYPGARCVRVTQTRRSQGVKLGTYVFTIGPILYSVHVIWYDYYSYIKPLHWWLWDHPEALAEWWFSEDGPRTDPFETPENYIAEVLPWGPEPDRIIQDKYQIEHEDHEHYAGWLSMYAGLYTEERYKKLISGAYNNDPAGEVAFTEWRTFNARDIPHLITPPEGMYLQYDLSLFAHNDLSAMTDGSLNFYTRPHN